MQESVWQYHPEFLIRVRINGQDAGEAVKVLPAPSTNGVMNDYGLLMRPIPGGLLGITRLFHNGTSFVPVIDIDEPITFSFWLVVRQGAAFPFLDFFSDGSRTFGRHIFYTNNLSSAGAIDSNLAGQVVSLTAGTTADDPERGALSTRLLSSAITPGDFTQIQAGKIIAGGPVAFSLSVPITPTQSSAALDFRPIPGGAYVVRLQGASPIEERVVVDEEAARAEVHGIIEIYKDSWQIAAQPREYRIDFSSS